MSNPSTASLYERLGGVYAIAAVVDVFIDRIMACPVLNANPLVDEAHHRVPPAGFKYLVTEMVCMATGGPQRYTGKAMKDSHDHLKITPAEWDTFAGHFKAVLDQFKVPEGEQKELFEIVGTTRGDIVMEPAPATRKAG
ncbi:MAG TPA: group 1 truncated hemoglobin [Myxococcaceae bacterium]|jgi:hemoglobin